MEHVIPRKHGGSDHETNLAWACIFCNLYKGPNLAGLDPDTGQLTPLFDPRQERWEVHFRLTYAQLIGVTAIGRTTVRLLGMNSNLMVSLRSALLDEGAW